MRPRSRGDRTKKAPILKRAREICVFLLFLPPENPKKAKRHVAALNPNRRCTAPDAARQRAESQSGPLDRKGSEPRLQGIFHEHGGRRSVDRPQDPDGAGHLRRGPLADPPHGQAARQRVRTPQDRRLAAFVPAQYAQGGHDADPHPERHPDPRGERNLDHRPLRFGHLGHRYGPERHGAELRRRHHDPADQALPRGRLHLGAGTVGHGARNQALLDGHHHG